MSKSLDTIEKKMRDIDEGSVRYQALLSAKNFKTSWIELGRWLYSVWKERLYKEWGYAAFDAYASKEIGVRKETALKLLKSYYFLEREEPSCLQKEYTASLEAKQVPNYESVNALRLAKNKNEIDRTDYVRLKRDVLEMGKDAREVKRDLTMLIKQRREVEPDEARKARRLAMIKRLLSTMKTLKTEIEASRMLPAGLVKDVSRLIMDLESEIA